MMGLVYEDNLMARPVLTILTPSLRPAGALETARSVQRANAHPWDLRHVIAYWPYEADPDRLRMGAWMTDVTRCVTSGWLLWVDDDNRLHPDLPRRLADIVLADDQAAAVVFDCAYPEQGGCLRACPEHMRPGRVDGGQVALRWDLAGAEPWGTGRYLDGVYLASLYRRAPESFRFVGETLTYHNHQVWGPCIS